MNTLVPWSRPGRLWRAACHVNLGLLMGIFTFSLTITFLALSVGLLITFFLALPAIWMLFTLARGLAKVERSRARALMGVEIADPIPPLTRPGWLGRLAERARSGPRWREIAYNLALLPVGVIGYALSTVAWSGSLAMVAMPFVVDHLPGSSAKFYFFELTSGPGAIAAAAVGVAGLLVRRPVDHAGGGQDPGIDGEGTARSQHGPGPRAAGVAPRDQPDGGGRQCRGRTTPHRARPPRRRPATAGRAGGRARCRPREVRRRSRTGASDGVGGPRGGESGAHGDP